MTIIHIQKHNKGVTVQGVPSSESKDDVTPMEYPNKTLNWEHVGSIHSTQILTHKHNVHTHGSCNIVIGVGVIYRPNSETERSAECLSGGVEITRGELLR